MNKRTFDIDSLNIDDILSTDEMATLDAGAAIPTTSYSSIFSTNTPSWNMHGEAIWSMIP